MGLKNPVFARTAVASRKNRNLTHLGVLRTKGLFQTKKHTGKQMETILHDDENDVPSKTLSDTHPSSSKHGQSQFYSAQLKFDAPLVSSFTTHLPNRTVKIETHQQQTPIDTPHDQPLLLVICREEPFIYLIAQRNRIRLSVIFCNKIDIETRAHYTHYTHSRNIIPLSKYLGIRYGILQPQR